MFLGIDDNTGLVYENVGSTPDRPVLPIPMVSQARLVRERGDWDGLPASYRGAPLTWLFREDAFDAVTRTRRGRLYQAVSGKGYLGERSQSAERRAVVEEQGEAGYNSLLGAVVNMDSSSRMARWLDRPND